MAFNLEKVIRGPIYKISHFSRLALFILAALFFATAIRAGDQPELRPIERVYAEADAEEFFRYEIREVLRGLVVPVIKFDDTPVAEALVEIEAILNRAEKHHPKLKYPLTIKYHPADTKVIPSGDDFEFKGGGGDATVRKSTVRMNLKNVSLGGLLDQISRETHMIDNIDFNESGIEIGSFSKPLRLLTYKYRVPNELIKVLRTSPWNGGGTMSCGDPHAKVPNPSKPTKVSLKYAFESAGITFVEGATIKFDKPTEVLSVTNVLNQIELVELYLKSFYVEFDGQIVDATAAHLQTLNLDFVTGLISAGGEALMSMSKTRKKLRTIQFPEIDFKDVPLKDAIEMIEKQALLLDTEEPDPDKRGVVIYFSDIVKDGSKGLFGFEGGGDPGSNDPMDTLVNLKLQKASLGKVLQYSISMSRLMFRVEPAGIEIRWRGVFDDEAFISRYQIPPSIFAQIQQGRTLPIQKILEEKGFRFVVDDYARYDAESEVLEFFGPTSQVEQLNVFLNSYNHGYAIPWVEK